ncbi:MAG: hypothetical protein NXI32_14855 [bacterium]|nr:hypothetical protein [bacterium]
MQVSRLCICGLILASLFRTSSLQADVIYDFSAAPITWSATQSTYSWDATGDSVHDFSISVVSGYIDAVSGLYVIDNNSTASGNIQKTFVFSITSLNASLPDVEVSLLGFDFYSEKNIEVGGRGGAGSISAMVIDDAFNSLVSGVNVSGSLGSNPSRVAIPVNSTSRTFALAVDTSTTPNADAQVIIGDIIFNSGSVRSFNSAVPEPQSGCALASALLIFLRRRRVC